MTAMQPGKGCSLGVRMLLWFKFKFVQVVVEKARAKNNLNLQNLRRLQPELLRLIRINSNPVWNCIIMQMDVTLNIVATRYTKF